MPHDIRGKTIAVGDRVLIPAIVESVQTGDEFCNVTVATVHPMPPGNSRMTFTLNTKQVAKIEQLVIRKDGEPDIDLFVMSDPAAPPPPAVVDPTTPG